MMMSELIDPLVPEGDAAVMFPYFVIHGKDHPKLHSALQITGPLLYRSRVWRADQEWILAGSGCAREQVRIASVVDVPDVPADLANEVDRLRAENRSLRKELDDIVACVRAENVEADTPLGHVRAMVTAAIRRMSRANDEASRAKRILSVVYRDIRQFMASIPDDTP